MSNEREDYEEGKTLSRNPKIVFALVLHIYTLFCRAYSHFFCMFHSAKCIHFNVKFIYSRNFVHRCHVAAEIYFVPNAGTVRVQVGLDAGEL